jgi:2'-5' RNA ligase
MSEQKPSYAYLARLDPIEPILEVQRIVRQAFGDTATYTEPDDFHITLVYCYGYTADGLIEPLIWAREGYAVLLDGLDFFDTPDGYAIHLTVRWDSASVVYQEELAANAEASGYELSEHSVPADWHPHVTLCYAPKPIKPVQLTKPIPLRITAIELSGDNHEVIAMQQLKQKDPPVQPEPVKPDQAKDKDADEKGEKGWFTGKYSQAEVGYTDYAVRRNPVNAVCQTCRWFGKKYDQYGAFMGHECHLVEDYPLDIVATGWCEEWTERAKPPDPTGPLEVVIVEPDDTEEGERSLGVAVAPPDTSAVARKGLFRRDEPITGPCFKIQGDDWLAVFSNNFEDREEEFFPQKAIDDFVFRVDTGIVPPPKLVIWHEVKADVGEAEWVGRVGNFLVAAGKFYTDKRSQRAKAYYKKNIASTKHSHGFFYEVAKYKDRAYWSFNTFEVTLLPKGAEANSYTTFGVKESNKMLTDQKRQYLENIFGKEDAAKWEANLEGAGKSLTELGVAYKDFTSASANTPAPGAGSKDGEGVGESYKALVGMALEGHGTTVNLVQGMHKAFDAERANWKAEREKLEGRLAAVEKALALKPEDASKSDKTEVADEDPNAKKANEDIEKKKSGKGNDYEDVMPGLFKNS